MAFVSPEYVRSLQSTHDAKYWKVYDGSGKTLINKLDADIGLNKSSEMLQETLDNCIADFVTVRLFTVAPAKTTAGAQHDTGLTLKVKLDNPNNTKPSGMYGMQPGISEYIALHDRIRQVELEKLKMEMESNQAESPWTRLGEKLLQNDALVLAITGAISKLAAGKPAQQKIAQPQPINAPTEIAETLTRLSAVDPDYINTLEKMTSYLENNPGVIDQIKPIFNA
jgi:hypothetical protein